NGSFEQRLFEASYRGCRTYDSRTAGVGPESLPSGSIVAKFQRLPQAGVVFKRKFPADREELLTQFGIPHDGVKSELTAGFGVEAGERFGGNPELQQIAVVAQFRPHAECVLAPLGGDNRTVITLPAQ